MNGILRGRTRALGLHLLILVPLALGCGGGDADSSGSAPGTGEPATEAGGSGSEAAPTAEVVGRAPAAVGGIPSVVSLIPETPAGPPSSEAVVVDQDGMAFIPKLVLARVGQTVRFGNSEAVPHNVHLRSMATQETLLNVNLDMGSESGVVIAEAGGYEVLCELHPGMSAFVYASPTPHIAFAAEDGSFTVSGVPPGDYTLLIWSADPEARSERELTVTSGRVEVAGVG